MNSDERLCPECAEVIKIAAKKCKHCGSSISALNQEKSVKVSSVAILGQVDSDLQINYAGFWRRCAADSIESAIWLVIGCVLILIKVIDQSSILNLVTSITYWALSLSFAFLYYSISRWL